MGKRVKIENYLDNDEFLILGLFSQIKGLINLTFRY